MKLTDEQREKLEDLIYIVLDDKHDSMKQAIDQIEAIVYPESEGGEELNK